MSRFKQIVFAALLLRLILLTGCQHLVIDTHKIVRSDTDLPEIVEIIAGFGTTFVAAFPDLLAMMRRRSSEGMNPRMGAIMGAFQILGCITACSLLRGQSLSGMSLQCSSTFWPSGIRLFPAQGEGKVSYRHWIEIKLMKERAMKPSGQTPP